VIVLSIQARLNEDKIEESQKLAEQLVAENPDWLPGKRLQATIALYLNDNAAAEKLFQDLILKSPADAQYTNDCDNSEKFDKGETCN
ncbi:MAG: hypothetical protein LBU65_15335, partial [Planctomycetaceae bacterium]|jgi:hypothetical protein|nr:hypothetical protein [Planctomycetaceae bacterium]